ncbi:MAG: sigma-70 family RNA polymerase sigma factor, partial [Chitinophagales bacterium]
MIVKKFEQYTDDEIIDKIAAGEIKLYEILIRRHNSMLYKIGRSYKFIHQDTEDLMQETFVNAYLNLSKFEKRSSFRTWIARIMLNNCYRKTQKSSYQKETVTENTMMENSSPLYSQRSNTESIIINKELGHVVENALNKIPEDYRVVFTLRELNGLSVSETSEILNITESNVKVRLNRTKAMLRSEIEKTYSPEDIYEFNLVYCDR